MPWVPLLGSVGRGCPGSPWAPPEGAGPAGSRSGGGRVVEAVQLGQQGGVGGEADRRPPGPAGSRVLGEQVGDGQSHRHERHGTGRALVESGVVGGEQERRHQGGPLWVSGAEWGWGQVVTGVSSKRVTVTIAGSTSSQAWFMKCWQSSSRATGSDRSNWPLTYRRRVVS